MNRKQILLITGCLAVGLLLALTGCDTFGQQSHRRTSSVLQYLYPSDNEHVDVATIPTLSLPLRVGIAFVPENNRDGHYYSSSDEQFSEQQKLALMQQVSTNFTKYPFVQSIELIPAAYVTPKGGFQNVDQLKRMFNVDVIVLLSYDQVQFTDRGLLSITYWTVVGAWVVRGEKNDTQTMVDAVVYDIDSRKLLFRAPGTSIVKASATPIGLSGQLRLDSAEGLNVAATNLVANLQQQLELFKDRVKNSPEEYQVVRKPGYTGAGSLGGLELAMVAGLGIFSIWTRKAQRA